MMNFSAATAAVRERAHHQDVTMTSPGKRFIEATEILVGFFLVEKFLCLFGHGQGSALKVMLDVLPSFVVDVLDRILRTGPVAHQDHRDCPCVLQLIKRSALNCGHHAGSQYGFTPVRKMHGALPLQHAERLIRVVAMHVVFVAGFGIDMYPCVQTFTVEDGFSLSFLVGNLQQVEDFYRHSSSLFYSQRNLLRFSLTIGLPKSILSVNPSFLHINID